MNAYHQAVDFVRYAERAADLVNLRLDDVGDLRAALTARAQLAGRVTRQDVAVIRETRTEIRAVFEASARGDEQEVVRTLNALLVRFPVSPSISGHDAQTWHLHVAEVETSVAETLLAEALMGMAVVVCDHGAGRFGICNAEPCRNAFVDTSPNRSRRYCSERCSSRANVAAFRARHKAAADKPPATALR